MDGVGSGQCGIDLAPNSVFLGAVRRRTLPLVVFAFSAQAWCSSPRLNSR